MIWPMTRKHCKECNQELRKIGEEVSEHYEYVPAQLKVIEDVCIKYACNCTVTTASKPPQPIEKSNAGASLLAQVIVSKFADHLPLNRQQKMFDRLGVSLPRQTLCDRMASSADLLAPLYERAKKLVLASKVVQTDDTPVKVLDRSLPRTRTGRIWPYIGDKEHPAVVYDYTPTRERAGPERFLEEYHGYLQADAYGAYDRFFTDPERGMTEVGCWAHARRHFHDALETDRARMGAASVEKIAAFCASRAPGQCWNSCMRICCAFARNCCRRAWPDRLWHTPLIIGTRWCVIAKTAILRSTTTRRSVRSGDLPWVEITGPFSAATTAGRRRRC
jgi:transposase